MKKKIKNEQELVSHAHRKEVGKITNIFIGMPQRDLYTTF